MNPRTPELHYSEADLLETYYLQPGASMPVMMHLADCTDCAARYERLEKKVRGLSACAHDEKPESFWARQRNGVLQKLSRRSSAARSSKVAAAALLVATLGGWMALRQPETAVASAPTAMVAEEVAVQVTTPADPWESEELDEYGSLVEWESWEDQS